MSNSPGKDDEISLEALMGEVSGVSVSVESEAETSPATDVESGEPAATKSDTGIIDNLLASEDPDFVSSMKDLQKLGAVAADLADIDPLDLDAISKEKAPGRIRLLFSRFLSPMGLSAGEGHTIGSRVLSLPFYLVELAQSALIYLKDLAVRVGRFARKVIIDFLGLPAKSKLTLFFALGLGIVAFVIMKFSLNGQLGIPVGSRFLRSFSELADQTFTYNETDPIDDFSDPIFHPEHVVMLDKFVINLRRPQDGSNPMGLFEFYLEASNQDSAVEINDRQGEIRDVISRTLEQFSYIEMASVAGKEKVKVILRKNINSVLTRGQVRHVFFKTVIVKP